MINSFVGPCRFLSNFYPSEITYEGITYPTVEHAFQASKTTILSLRAGMALLPTPDEAKKAGRKLALRADWEDIKDQVMEDCVRLKFAIPELKEKLLATGDEELVEGTWWHDQYWGICFCDLHQGKGENHLGKILMKIREELKD